LQTTCATDTSIRLSNTLLTKPTNAPIIAPITGSSTLCYGEKATLQTAVGDGIGLNWVWQKQDSARWTPTDTNKVQITTLPLFSPTNYRVVATCLLDSTTATSAPFAISVNQPTYATLPYRQDFEAWQSTTCAIGTLQAQPDNRWSNVHKSLTGWQQQAIDIQHLPSGIYWLTITTDKGQRFIQKVIR
jgi:hypothetical protein